MDERTPAFQKAPPSSSRPAQLKATVPSSKQLEDSGETARGLLQQDNWKLAKELKKTKELLKQERSRLEQAEDRHRTEARALSARMRVLSNATGAALASVAAAWAHHSPDSGPASQWLPAAKAALRQDLADASVDPGASSFGRLLSQVPWAREDGGQQAAAATGAGEGGESFEQVLLERNALAQYAREYQAQLKSANNALQQHKSALEAAQARNRCLAEELEQASLAAARGRSREERRTGEAAEVMYIRDGGDGGGKAAALAERVKELRGFLRQRESELAAERAKREQMGLAHAEALAKKQEEGLELRSCIQEMASTEQADRLRLQLWGDFGGQLSKAVREVKGRAELELDRLDSRILELERSLPEKYEMARKAVQHAQGLMAELAVERHKNEALQAVNSSNQARHGWQEDQAKQQLAITKKLLLAETETRLLLERRCQVLRQRLDSAGVHAVLPDEEHSQEQAPSEELGRPGLTVSQVVEEHISEGGEGEGWASNRAAEQDWRPEDELGDGGASQSEEAAVEDCWEDGDEEQVVQEQGEEVEDWGLSSSGAE